MRRPKNATKITMMAGVSKRSGQPKNRIGKKYFHPPKFWPRKCSEKRARLLFFQKPTQARKRENKIKGISKSIRIWDGLGLLVDIWWYIWIRIDGRYMVVIYMAAEMMVAWWWYMAATTKMVWWRRDNL